MRYSDIRSTATTTKNIYKITMCKQNKKSIESFFLNKHFKGARKFTKLSAPVTLC